MTNTSSLTDVIALQKLDVVPAILNIVCRVTGMGVCAVARVTGERWIACSVKDNIGFGLAAGDELDIKTIFFDEVRHHEKRVIFEHVSRDERYRDYHSPQVGFESFISVPIFRQNGRFFGTLCAFDPAPASIDNPETIVMFELFAQLIGAHLAYIDRVSTSEDALAQEREIGTRREQFIAILSHDLRNPLGSIDAGVQLIRRRTAEPKVLSLATRIDRSVKRMSGLIANLMGFSRARLGDGFTLAISRNALLTPALVEVVDELREVWPEREIRCDIDDLGPVSCDPERLAQLLSNLLANALSNGSEDEPIIVTGSRIQNEIHLAVENGGDPIPEAIVRHLFKPFHRTDRSSAAEGLGLSLFIAMEIAKAHGGNIAVRSRASRVRFTFSMVYPVALR